MSPAEFSFPHTHTQIGFLQKELVVLTKRAKELWLNFWPNLSDSRPSGNCASSKLRLNSRPKLRLRRLGRAKLRPWLYMAPKLKVRNFGSARPDKLWLNSSSKLSSSKPSGSSTSPQKEKWHLGQPKNVQPDVCHLVGGNGSAFLLVVPFERKTRDRAPSKKTVAPPNFPKTSP